MENILPVLKGLKDTGFKGQFRFLKTPAPWLILGATALGNGGVFCWYSYINPMLTNVSGFGMVHPPEPDNGSLPLPQAGKGAAVGKPLRHLFPVHAVTAALHPHLLHALRLRDVGL